MFELAKDCKVVRLMNAVAAGTSDQTSSYVDTNGYENVAFLTAFGTIDGGAVTSVKLQDCATSGGSYNDIASSKQTVADSNDNKVTVHEIVRPKLRYVQVYIDRGTANAVIDGVWAFLYNGHKTPITADSSVIGTVQLISPADGTA